MLVTHIDRSFQPEVRPQDGFSLLCCEGVSATMTSLLTLDHLRECVYINPASLFYFSQADLLVYMESERLLGFNRFIRFR